ncbi:MAG: VWD domain-containing protein [Herpetosiphonaceae bacterium]|nr:VWD domain-containing protein [Herpetosiphonaceae bacterium]
MTGNVTAGSDSITFAVGSTLFASPGTNSVHAAAGWTIAEFNVFGDAGGGQANFAAGTTVIPRSRITYGGTTAPNCVAQGFTGETNNLNFGPGTPASSPPGPAVFFNMTNAGGALTSCSGSTTVGDTHLITFNGLLYDFQASGDFILAQAPDFVVHARQVSGAPTWPDAAVNQAIATRMGGNAIAICPTRDGPALTVNGRPTELANNQPLSLDGGVDIWQEGDNVYTILDQAGNAVRATINANPRYVNVSVGLGTQPETVTGVLANANNNVSQIAARDGTVLTAPFLFGGLYGSYGTGWRVPPLEDTLLSACGSITENSIPSKPFYTKDLDIQLSAPALKICQAAGVDDPALLDACTLDVAVLGTESAATVYVGMSPPIAVGQVVLTTNTYVPLVNK